MAAATCVTVSSCCALGETPSLSVQEGLGLALPGCTTMGLTAAMLAAPYLRPADRIRTPSSRFSC